MDSNFCCEKNHGKLQTAPVVCVTDITDTIIIVIIMQVREEGLFWDTILLFMKFVDGSSQYKITCEYQYII